MSKALTVGTPWKVMVLFAIPLLIGNVVQQMYQVADAMVVGQHLGVNALAAVGSTGSILFLLIGFAQGMTQGFSIPLAQAFGAGDYDGVRRSVAAGTILTAISSLILTVAAPFLARPFLVLLQTPPELLEDATRFAVINFLGVSAIMFFNYLSAIIRAIGDSRTPLVFLIIACVINVGLVVLFVQFLEFGVAGAALATVIAQLISVIACLVYLMRSIPVLHTRRSDWKADRALLGKHLRIGLPMGFQMSIVAIGTLAVQVRLNMLGTNAVAAYTTALRVDGLAVFFLASLGLAVATFVAQNYGAGHMERIRVGVRQALMISVGISVVMSVTLITLGEPILRMFVGKDEQTVVSMAHEYLVINGMLYVVLGFLFITRNALQGLGRTLVPTVSGLLELGMRVAAAIVLGDLFGFTGVVWGTPLAWIAASALLVPSWIMAKRSLIQTDDGAAAPLETQGLEPAAEGDMANVVVETNADTTGAEGPERQARSSETGTFPVTVVAS